jgi:altronate dehydratase large subunit
MNGGLTTLEEKSLGCICKTGSGPLAEVVAYGQKPKKRGLIFVDGTGFDIPSITGMVAAGAQVVAFTTGRGSPVGYPIAPVVKITGNPATHARMEEIFDVNAGTIVEGKQDLNQVAERIFQEVIAAAGGKQTKAESFGFADFSIATIAGAYSGV